MRADQAMSRKLHATLSEKSRRLNFTLARIESVCLCPANQYFRMAERVSWSFSQSKCYQRHHWTSGLFNLSDGQWFCFARETTVLLTKRWSPPGVAGSRESVDGSQVQKHKNDDVSPHQLHFVFGTRQLCWVLSLLDCGSFFAIKGVLCNSLDEKFIVNYVLRIIYGTVIVPSPERRQWCPMSCNLRWSCDQHKPANHLLLLEPFFPHDLQQRRRRHSDSFRSESINWTQNICWLSRLRRVIGVECQKRQDNNLNG